MPLGLEVVRLASLDRYVQKSINDFIGNLFQSIAIVMAVMLLFLGLRTGLVVPLLISTLTTAAAFLSFFLAESTMGDIMGPLFVVISFALISSWILSLTIIPLLAAFFVSLIGFGKIPFIFFPDRDRSPMIWAIHRMKPIPAMRIF